MGSAGRVRGQATSFLLSLRPADSLRLFLRPSVVPYSLTPVPKILVSTGTGVAAHVAFIHLLADANLLNPRDFIVVHGCRDVSTDFLLPRLLPDLQGKAEVRVAFSRASPDKRYVQHELEEDKEGLFADFLARNHGRCEIYLCGNSRFLPQAILRALRTRLAALMDPAAAQTALDSLERRGLLRFETFG